MDAVRQKDNEQATLWNGLAGRTAAPLSRRPKRLPRTPADVWGAHEDGEIAS